MKRGLKVVFTLSFILIFSMTFVSAGLFGDILKKVITGNPIGNSISELEANGAVCISDSECISGACDYDIFSDNYHEGNVQAAGDIKYCHSNSSKCLFYSGWMQENDIGCTRCGSWENSLLGNENDDVHGNWDDFIDTCGKNSNWENYVDCAGNTPYCNANSQSGFCNVSCVQCIINSDCSGSTPICVNNICVADVSKCGNGVQDVGEQCDGSKWAVSASCEYFGYASGHLGCKSDCTFNYSKCVSSDCIDSDGGLNYYEKGTTYVGNTPNFDVCSDSFILWEYGCDDMNTFRSQSYACPNGCFDGACVSEVYPYPFIVGDSANVAIVYGTNVGTSSVELVQAATIKADLENKISLSGGTLGNVLVKDAEVGSVSTKNLIVIGTPCSNSAIMNILDISNCNSTAVSAKLGIGEGQFIIKTISDSSISSKVVLLIMGYNVKDVVSAVNYLRSHQISTSIESTYRGTNSSDVVENRDCYDSDGEDIYTKGTAKGTVSDGAFGPMEEYCFEEGIGRVSEGVLLVEFTCPTPDGYVKGTIINCPNGCVNGACVLQSFCKEGDHALSANCTLYEGEKFILGDEYPISIEFIDFDSVKLRFDQTLEISPLLSEGDFYDYLKDGGGSYMRIKVEKILYTSEESSVSKVILSIEVLEEETVCERECYLNERCYPLEYRKSNLYCSEEYGISLFTPQLENGEKCSSDYECLSDVCGTENLCYSGTVIQQVVNWVENIFK